MNRMIRLFQTKSNVAFEKYVQNRDNAIKQARIDTPEWNAAVQRGSSLKAEYETWQKAADLLRKEELTR